MINAIGIAIGIAGVRSEIFSTTQWQLIAQQWQNITTTWN